MALSRLEDLIEMVKSKPKKKVIVSFAQEENTIIACRDAVNLGFADITLIGNEEEILQICSNNNVNPELFTIVNETEDIAAAQKSIDMIKAGNGDVLMKGLISTDRLLKCILNKDSGLMLPKALLSHVSIAQIPHYRKLLIFTDAAFIPRPDIDQKIAMTRYVINTARKIGVKRPKVAIISFSEKANPKIKEAVDGLIISKMGEQGLIKHADIDGPLSIDLAIDPESVRTKGVKSCVNGDADCLVFPFLEVGNVFFKSLTKFAKAEIATHIVGTQVPVVISSRTDTAKSKFYSMAFNCLMANEV